MYILALTLLLLIYLLLNFQSSDHVFTHQKNLSYYALYQFYFYFGIRYHSTYYSYTKHSYYNTNYGLFYYYYSNFLIKCSPNIFFPLKNYSTFNHNFKINPHLTYTLILQYKKVNSNYPTPSYCLKSHLPLKTTTITIHSILFKTTITSLNTTYLSKYYY